jgi:hypothetical protein
MFAAKSGCSICLVCGFRDVEGLAGRETEFALQGLYVVGLEGWEGIVRKGGDKN